MSRSARPQSLDEAIDSYEDLLSRKREAEERLTELIRQVKEARPLLAARLYDEAGAGRYRRKDCTYRPYRDRQGFDREKDAPPRASTSAPTKGGRP